MSATALAKFLGGYGELTLDEETQTVYVEAIETNHDESPDDRHSEEDLADETEDRVMSESDGGNDSIDLTVVGELVHRLCELRPPESKWANVMEQTLVDEGATVDLTPALRKRVSEHVHRGIDYVNAQVASSDIEQQYDELYVTAEFEHGEIAGYIDHLIVTPEAYHIIDYKTGDVTREELEDDAGYYLNQMKAYAIALNQQGTGCAVRVSLVFTGLNDAWEVEWSVGEIEAIENKLQAEGETEMEF